MASLLVRSTTTKHPSSILVALVILWAVVIFPQNNFYSLDFIVWVSNLQKWMVMLILGLTIFAIIEILTHWTFVSDTSNVPHFTTVTNYVIMDDLFFLLLLVFLNLLLLFLFLHVFPEVTMSSFFVLLLPLFQLLLYFLGNIFLNETLSLFIKLFHWMLQNSRLLHHYFIWVNRIMVEWNLFIKTQNLTFLKFILLE